MNDKRTIEHHINDFLQIWDASKIYDFLNDVLPLFELYNVDEEDDWVKDEVGEEDRNNVRLIRTVYLLSKIADKHSASLCHMKITHRHLWEKMEKIKEE